MGKYALFLLFLVYGCFVQKKSEPIPPEPVSWEVNVKEVELYSYEYSHGQKWVGTYDSTPYYYPGSDSVLINFLRFPHGDNFFYTCYVREHNDSVTLGPIQFIAKDGMILSSELRAPDYHLTLYNPLKIYHYSRDYFTYVLFGNFISTPVKEDFFRSDGSLHQSLLKDAFGKDSICSSWYPDGSLQARKDRHRMDYYFENGTRMSVSDTMVKRDYYLICARFFYANGRLQREEYYDIDYKTPVYNWTYYNEKGKLIKTVKKKKLELIETDYIVSDYEYEPFIFVTTLDNTDKWEESIRNKLTVTLTKYLNENQEYEILPGTYTFQIKLGYSRGYQVSTESLNQTSLNPQYQEWLNKQVSSSIRDKAFSEPLRRGSRQVEPTFRVTLEISPQEKKLRE